MEPRRDRRIARTRAALLDAFNHLVLVRRQRRIRVADIVEEANVGRSTFYEHYSGADALFLDALSHPFAILADALASGGDPAKLAFLLEHFWENRAKARETFTGRLDARVSRLLATMVEERLAAAGAEFAVPLRLASLQLAEAALAPIRAWIMGAAPCTPEALAGAIFRSAEAQRGALRVSG